MTSTSRRLGLAPALMIAFSSAVHAQAQPPDPTDTPRMRVGPVALTPRFDVLDLGFDSNVFNEAEGPKQDFSATMRPGLDAAMCLGPARFMYRSHVDLVYFHEYDAERSLNRAVEGRAELRTARFVPFVSVRAANTRERPNNEIDLRARRDTRTFSAGAAVLLFSRTAFVIEGQHHRLEYQQGQQFFGIDLAEQLNHDRDVVEGGLRFALTPLTTLSLTAGRERNRFAFSPERDAGSLRFMQRLDFDPSALITGHAAVGYRRFTPEHETLQEFRGVVAEVGVRWTLFSRTRVALEVNRDLAYSFEQEQPYYVSTAGRLVITQQIRGPFDVQAMGSHERWRYRPSPAAAGAEAAVDTARRIGGGVGYRLGTTARVGLNVEFLDRDAHRAQRSYDRRRIFGSVTHEF